MGTHSTATNVFLRAAREHLSVNATTEERPFLYLCPSASIRGLEPTIPFRRPISALTSAAVPNAPTRELQLCRRFLRQFWGECKMMDSQEESLLPPAAAIRGS